jgi:hypothetical protein
VTGDLVEAIDASGDVTQAPPLSQLAELDGRDAEIFGVPSRHMAVLILGALKERLTIGLCECRGW